ncbi:hypothetical protein [Streptomyces albipurpureus]|uniref:Uncharacterized protein n=1 Tax=Streptomyces albipurpureus TaxID=2897419 RepID=A0ABT0UQX4_9ACTN|nr:hypothetical protein [Streptomyces sp. CWNU-1]MCM2390500.1 hypothetical protein [Streptomyces sp. CWNU-1]
MGVDDSRPLGSGRLLWSTVWDIYPEIVLGSVGTAVTDGNLTPPFGHRRHG